jgi:hypothetical protein
MRSAHTADLLIQYRTSEFAVALATYLFFGGFLVLGFTVIRPPPALPFAPARFALETLRFDARFCSHANLMPPSFDIAFLHR